MSKSELDHVKKLVEEGLKKGARILVENHGASYGPICTCCGKTGIEFLGLMVVPEGEDPYEDSSQYVVGMFGKTCFKNSGIKATRLEDYEEDAAPALKQAANPVFSSGEKGLLKMVVEEQINKLNGKIKRTHDQGKIQVIHEEIEMWERLKNKVQG